MPVSDGMRTLLTLLVLAGFSRARTPDEPLRGFDLVDNGDFREESGATGDARERRVPWWKGKSKGKPAQLDRKSDEDGTVWLYTRPGTVAIQPIAAYAPLAGELVLKGRVRGDGLVVLVDGAGDVAQFPVSDGPFAITGTELVNALGRAPRPRLELYLATAPEGELASWTGVQAIVTLPCPGEEALRAEVLDHLDHIFALWFEHGMEPPETDTGFIHHYFDAVTGERWREVPGRLVPLFESLLDALEVHEDPEWRARFERFLEAYLERGLHAETGLPNVWSLKQGRADVDRWIEPHADLGFLLDVAERGPERFRARALAAAVKMGAAIVTSGVLPDGNVAAKYRARDGACSLDAIPLRRLDTPAQLARLGAVTGDPRFTAVARNALAEFEFTHHWPCDWEHIDPGFDDDFGIYGQRALVMLVAHPEEEAFRALVRSGYDYYAPRWRDALRFGGTVAADQVRCWEMMLGFAELEPALLPEVSELLPAALRNHVKGTQYKNGAWGDVTIAAFDPQIGIQVGDLPGSPSNLLQGIALCYDDRLGMDPELVRGLFTAVLRSTDEAYRRPYGYLMTEREVAGLNPAGGGIRLLRGLTEMLRRLE